ncbi:energy transducer TonB [Arcticibacter sp. MXS-1]|uniref:energy transducer TonB n=1 Tax=Arcticibacter sp. MXS-1 TaxID=3341726 RepID=UPI0035A92051
MFTDKFDVYRSEWLELVFANRNHEYGAYQLRKEYASNLNKALLLASIIFVVGFTIPVVIRNFGADIPEAPQPALISDDRPIVVDLSHVKELPPPPLPAGMEQKIKTTRFVPPRVVAAAQVTEEMPDVQTLQKSTIATKTQEGIEVPAIESPASLPATGGAGTGEVSTGEGDGLVDFHLVEKFPEFPGGVEAFGNYLRKNLRYPASAVDNNVAGRVFVSFIVERDGTLTDIKVVKGIGFGCDEEAVRVLKKSPAWSPGIQNKQRVRVQYTLPIMFSLGE